MGTGLLGPSLRGPQIPQSCTPTLSCLCPRAVTHWSVTETGTRSDVLVPGFILRMPLVGPGLPGACRTPSEGEGWSLSFPNAPSPAP